MINNAGRYAVELDAHSLDGEFESIILRDYGVVVSDRTGEPWSVIFEGSRDGLARMVQDHWGGSIELQPEDFTPAPAEPAAKEG